MYNNQIRIWMLTKILWAPVMFALTVMPAMALEVHTRERYYIVDPESHKDAYIAILRASPSADGDPEMKILGHYLPKVTYEVSFAARGKICYIKDLSIILDGELMLPKIKEDKVYPHSVTTAFAVAAHDTIDNEKKHLRLFIDRLKESEVQFAQLRDSDDPNCEKVGEKLAADFNQLMEEIYAENLSFDCYEYGNRFALKDCEQYSFRGKKAQKPPQFSTFSDNSGKTGVVSYDQKPKESECKGTIIEPFKGKFYCIEGKHKK